MCSLPRASARVRRLASPLFLLAFILIVAAGLRFYRLDGSSLWSDEGNTWALIGRDWATIARHAAADIHPPGYYWLLKVWSLVAGSDAAGMRSLSASAGVLLVAATYGVARRLLRSEGRGGENPGTLLALTAAWVAALNPLQVYYSQEARMYMLLALWGVGLLWALVAWMQREAQAANLRRGVTAPVVWFVLLGALGLWTHYSFPILLAAAGLAYLWHWRGLLQAGRDATYALSRYVAANAAVVALFSPWLPTAVERVLNWPKGGVGVGPSEGLRLTLQTLTAGPLRDLPAPLWPWLAGFAALVLLGALRVARQPSGVAVMLWLAAPVALMAALGLFTDAFLKFLLVASPAWAILVAAGLLWRRPRAGALMTATAAAVWAVMVLPAYYASPTARDNYAGVARYVAAAGDPDRDVVLLNAPGQRDVWGYYDPGLPLLTLPSSRPPDPEATRAELDAALTDRRHVYALFWATDEADPARLVESRLDQIAFRGLESWQGNLRFVVYTLPNRLVCHDLAPAPRFGPSIRLVAHCDGGEAGRVPSGEVALVGLRWQTADVLQERIKVTVQLLDARNQVLAQHDAEPAGGSRPSDGWLPGEVIADNHGLNLPSGVPPGDYRLIVALYDPLTGVRLPTETGDHLALGTVTVTRPLRRLPVDVIPMQHRVQGELGPVTLLGYDLHRKDHSHAPQTPVQAGELVHFSLLWLAPDPLPATWPADATFTLRLGGQELRAPLAGGGYPTAQWQPGEVVRGEFDLLYDGGDRTPILEVDGAQLRLAHVPR